VALDGVGLLLQGAPDRLAYECKQAPVYSARFGSGDRSYSDFSFWWYLTQSDWSGGFKEETKWVDDAMFYYSTNIDARTTPGVMRLERALTQVLDNTTGSDPVVDVRNYSWGSGHTETLILADEVRTLAGVNVSDSNLGHATFALPFKRNLWVGNLQAADGNRLWYTAEDTGSPYAFTDVGATVNAQIDGSIDSSDVMVDVGGATLYVFGTSDVGNVYIVTTTSATGATFSLVSQFPVEGYAGRVVGAAQLGSSIVFLTGGDGQWVLYLLTIATGVVTVLDRFYGGVQLGTYDCGKKYVTYYKGKLLITFISDNTGGEGAIYEYDGSTLTKIFQTDRTKDAFSTPEATAFLRGGAVVYDDCAFWGNLVYDGEHFYNFSKSNDDSTTYALIPIGTDGSLLYLTDNRTTSGDTQVIVYSYNRLGTSYKTNGSLVFSQHDNIQSIDKLLNTVTIGFDQFLTGQSIKIYYTTNPLPDPSISTGNWSLLGTASYAIDGGSVTNKTFLFPTGTIAKKVWFRADLASGGADTPGLLDFTLEYLPMPTYKKEWTLNVNAGDEVKRLDGALVETTGRELKGRLERAWWTKSVLMFEDFDYATTAINDGAGLTATATTITVDSTYDFPEQGRLRIEDEEVTYTGKTPTTFTGVTRGARDTRAVTHANDVVVNNAYKVIITEMQSKIPISLEDREMEWNVGIALREV